MTGNKEVPVRLSEAFNAFGTEFQPWGPRVAITQREVDTFTDLTGDDNEIHVAMPGRKTVVPGLMTLAYLPRLLPGGIPLSQPDYLTINKGFSSIEFNLPVHVGDLIRMRYKAVSLEMSPFGPKANFAFEIGFERDVTRVVRVLRGMNTLLFLKEKTPE